jgi:hypothetical protein
MGVAFADVALASGFTHADEGRGVVAFDADSDGDQDVLAFTNGGWLEYYRNDTVQAGGWLRLRLDSTPNPLVAPDGFNARVTATIGGQSYHRYVNGSPSYLATGELEVHFGLGGATQVDELRIDWPRGYSTVLQDVPVNQLLVIACPAPRDLDGSGSVDLADLQSLIDNWGPVVGVPQLRADLDNDGVVGMGDLLRWTEGYDSQPLIIYRRGGRLFVSPSGGPEIYIPAGGWTKAQRTL